MACLISTSHPPCRLTWVLLPLELFADLQSLRPRVPPSQNFFQMAYPLTGGTDAFGCGTGSTLTGRPGAGLVTCFRLRSG